MIVENLNPKQREAVEHIEGPLLVLAGAGSGKTRIVTHRIAYLLHKGTPSSDVVAVTFANKAAEEMRKRVFQLIQKQVLTCTFHSLGARILRENGHLLGFSSHFTIYDEEDSLKLLKTCIQSLSLKEEKGLLKTLRVKISAAKNDLISPQQIPKESFFSQKEEKLFFDLYPMYQQRLKECNALDFDDLLFLSVKLLQEFPSLQQLYQDRWPFLLIDEYQDTNYAQYILAKLLVGKTYNLFAVGDPDQSIYSWRGARYQNILQFSSDFPGAKIITLEQNYRSTSTILSAANSVIAHNRSRYEKNLWSQLGEGEKIEVGYTQNEKEEAFYVWEKIQELQTKQKLSLDQMVIFYRTNAQSRVLEDLFLSRRIPYQMIGGLSFYQRKEIKDMLAFLKMVVSDSDFISFLRTVPLIQKGLGATSLKKILHASQSAQIPIFTFCRQIIQRAFPELSLGRYPMQALKEYVEKIQSLKGFKQQNPSLSQWIQAVLKTTNYLSLLKEDPETWEDRRENIEALLAKAAEYEEEDSDLPSFLEEISLNTTTKPSHDPCIKLMTLHHGKGLEFEAVFLVGLEEDILPHVNAKDNLEQLEEERRLFYVGITRAKRYLYLSASLYRYIWGYPRNMVPSRFLQEIPEPLLCGPRKKSASLSNLSSPLSPGVKIYHREFGYGIIQKAYTTSYGLTYDIYFESPSMVRSLVDEPIPVMDF